MSGKVPTTIPMTTSLTDNDITMDEEAEFENSETFRYEIPSRYQRSDGDTFLSKINRNALAIQPGPENINTYWVGYWFELARRALIRVDQTVYWRS